MIKQLAEVEEFRQCLNQNNLERRMGDRSLVLRFLAFYERHYSKARAGLKQFLNEFFRTYQNPSDDKLREYEREFRKALKASRTIFGDHGFRLRRSDGRGGGEWASRPNAAIFQAVAVALTKYDLGQLTRAADAIFEEYLDLVGSDEQWCDSVKASTGDANRIEYVCRTWEDRLAEVMKHETPNDQVRCFSRQLKDEMFRQDAACALCGQAIRLLNDAALDHDTHYWRGGRTIPSNARLVHRTCNQRRPK